MRRNRESSGKFPATLGLFTLGLLLSAAVGDVFAQAAPQGAGAIEHGKYLVTISGCNDCHTPLKMGPQGPEPDMSRMLSGHPAGLAMPSPPKLDQQWMWAGSSSMTAFVGPWGVDYAPNLTPDEETGIGAWDAALFIAAIRNGKIMGAGRPIMPPMPWQGIAKMTDEDLKAVFAYLADDSLRSRTRCRSTFLLRLREGPEATETRPEPRLRSSSGPDSARNKA